MKPTPAELDTLRALELSGAVTLKELQKEFPEVLPVHLDRFCAAGLAHKEAIPNKPSIWSITPKGRRAAKADGAYVGEVPTPRYRPEPQPYRVPAPIVTRAGAMDAYRLPSLVGGEVVERRAPIINGGSKERG